MAYSNGIITAPVTFDDLKLCFGLAANDLATIIQNASINKWAMCKPNRLSPDQPFAEYDTQGVPEWVQGIVQSNKAYGVDWSGAVVTSATALLALYGTLTNGVWANSGGNNTAWAYDRPCVADGNAMRIGDFRGYDKNAAPIVGNFVLTEMVTRGGRKCLYNQDIPNQTDTAGNIHFRLYVAPSIAGDKRLYLGNLMLDASTTMTSLYFGIVRLYYNPSGVLTKELLYVTSSTAGATIDSQNYANLTVNIKQSGSTYINRWVFTDSGTMYVIVPCLVTGDRSKMVALPNVEPMVLYTVLGSSVWECNVYTEDADMEVPYRVTLHNYSSEDRAVTVRCVLSSDGEIDWTEEENDYDITVEAGSDYIIPGEEDFDSLAADQDIARSHLYLAVIVDGVTLYNKCVTEIDGWS